MQTARCSQSHISLRTDAAARLSPNARRRAVAPGATMLELSETRSTSTPFPGRSFVACTIARVQCKRMASKAMTMAACGTSAARCLWPEAPNQHALSVASYEALP